MRLIILSSQLMAVLITIIQCDARSTRVTAQYTVADDSENSQRTFRGKGIVEDAPIVDDGILTKYNSRPSRNPPSRGTKKKVHSSPSLDYEQHSFHHDKVPEIFALKGKVIDGDITVPTRSSYKSHPTQQRVKNVGKAKIQSVPLQQQFRFPSIKNEEIFETKLQEAPTTLNTKKFKPENIERPIYSYSTIKFNGDDNIEEEVFPKKLKGKPPKRSTASFNLEQNFGGQQTKFDTIINHSDAQYDSNGFKPSTQFQFPTTTKTTTRKHKTQPPKLFKSPEDEFKDSEFFDFSIRPRPGQSQTSGKYEKFSSDLGVKTLAIKPHKNKFDPPQIHNGGFKPSYKLKDITNLHSGDIGQGVASPGQIKQFYDAVDSERDERYALKLSNDPSPTSKAQLAQFLRAKEDERLEKLVEEQFKLHQQKQIQHEKEAELKHQQLLLQRQKEKIKHVEKNLSNKVNQRPKRRPNQQSNYSRRQQRNPSHVGFSVTGAGKGQVPMRTVKGKDGSYRVSFSI